MLDIDTTSVRQASEFVSDAGQFLHPDLDADVPACGSDDVSQALMNNLNARRRWLLAHVRAGATQASNAAAGINDTATNYEAQDAAGAEGYSGSSGAAPGPGSAATPGASPAPVSMPTFSAIPDVSGTDGETVAQQLELGPGATPALAAATHLSTLSSRAHLANTSLTLAQNHLVAAGESGAHPGLMRRLSQAIAWTAGVAGHADALAAGYGGAGDLHTTTLASVGPSATWRTLKTAYAEAVVENQLTGGLSQAKVDALQAALIDKDTVKGAAMSGYQDSGQVMSTPPGTLPDPGLDPNSDTDSADDEPGTTEKSPLGDIGKESGGVQDMLGPLMGALGPLTQSLGQANPLTSLGQAAQGLGQQASKLGEQATKANPIKPASLNTPARLGKGGGGAKGGGGGSSPIKPTSPLRSTGLSGAPGASPATAEPTKAAAASTGRGAGAGAGGGMGMMPMGHKPGGSGKSEKIDSYDDPLAEVEEAGRPGVVGAEAKPDPVVNPDAQNAVAARIRRRKQEIAAESS